MDVSFALGITGAGSPQSKQRSGRTTLPENTSVLRSGGHMPNSQEHETVFQAQLGQVL
jgi:hypothetical protein